MEHVAIDLGGRESQVCIRAADGSVLLEQKRRTTQLSALFKRRPRSRVILETCAEAFRVADQAVAHGHEVRVVAATLVRTLGVGHRGIKTDQRDARVLSEVSCRIDLPTVHIRSERARIWKSTLGMRQGLVEARTSLINNVRGFLRTQLLSLRTGGVISFPERVRTKLLATADGLSAAIERQLCVIEVLNEQIKDADKELKLLAETDAVCQRLMTIPGVGVMSAIHNGDDRSRRGGANKWRTSRWHASSSASCTRCGATTRSTTRARSVESSPARGSLETELRQIR